MTPDPFLLPLTHLLLDHEFVALHHELKLVPSGTELAQLLHPSTGHGAQELVLTLGLLKQGLDLREKCDNWLGQGILEKSMLLLSLERNLSHSICQLVN